RDQAWFSRQPPRSRPAVGELHPPARIIGRAGDGSGGVALSASAEGSDVARIVIVGAGIGGLVSALMLGRQGHSVIVCERDAAAVPSDPDSMWSDWPRPGTPHARLGHTFLAGAR